jgi:hypothetical protein
MKRIIERCTKGGEDGLRTALKNYFVLMMDRKDEDARKFLEAVIPRMPDRERDHLAFVVREFLTSISYATEEDRVESETATATVSDLLGRLAKKSKT